MSQPNQKIAVEALRRIRLARTRLMWDRDPKRCFFQQVAVQLEPTLHVDVPTCATDGRSLFFNPAWILRLPADPLYAVVCGHEPLHPAMEHHQRAEQRNLYLWNIACDLAINPILLDAGFVLPQKVLLPEAFGFPPGKSAEWYYDALLTKASACDGACQGDRGAGEPGDSSCAPDPGEMGAVLPAPQAEANGVPVDPARWRRIVIQAAHVAKQRGSLPGGIDELIESICAPKVAWQDVLRRFVSRRMDERDDYSWRYPNRRYLSRGIYMPSLKSESIGDIVLHLDTSASTRRLMKMFASEMRGILEECRATAIVIYCDAAVRRVDYWRPSEGELEIRRVGGGGTSHRPVWDWISKEGIQPSCVVTFTDGLTNWGTEPPYPVLVALPKSDNPVTPPFGEVVLIDAAED